MLISANNKIPKRGNTMENFVCQGMQVFLSSTGLSTR